jgi:indole-3-glycerol phosphate synthase
MTPAQSRPALWLDRIVQAKRRELEQLRRSVPQAALEKRIVPRERRIFRQALLDAAAEREFAVIAEMKRASPSRGMLCASYDPVTIAQRYQASGAAALSVLTDREFFSGSLEDLRRVKASTALPVLRKDFILAPYHIYEAAAAGADAILLIAAILPPNELSALLQLSHSLGLDALVEVHNAAELEAALQAGSDCIGVNNRNLDTLEVSLNTSVELIDNIPDTVVSISESGIREAEDLTSLRAAGFDAFLIGERFMTETDPGTALRALLSAVAEVEPSKTPAATRRVH